MVGGRELRCRPAPDIAAGDNASWERKLGGGLANLAAHRLLRWGFCRIPALPLARASRQASGFQRKVALDVLGGRAVAAAASRLHLHMHWHLLDLSLQTFQRPFVTARLKTAALTHHAVHFFHSCVPPSILHCSGPCGSHRNTRDLLQLSLPTHPSTIPL